MAEMYSTFVSGKRVIINALDDKSVTFALILMVTAIIFYVKFRGKKYKLPPGPVGIPILGYLPFLGKEPYKNLHKLKDVYGNVFSLYIGRTYTVILADYEALKDAFSKPSTLNKSEKAFNFIPDGIGFSSVNGPEWVEQRRFCVKSMRDNGIGKERWELMVQSEVDDFIKLVSSSNGQPIDICEMLTSSISNNISSFVLGRRLLLHSPERKFLDHAVDEIMNTFKQTDIFNIFPLLWNVCAKLGLGRVKEIQNTMMEFNKFMKKEAENLRTHNKDTESENFITDYLKEMASNKKKYFNDASLIGNIQGLFLGGSETVRTAIYWLLLIMADNPDIQTKVQYEVDSVIGKDGQIRWSERKKLPYTLAVILEGQRWRTMTPLNTARLASEELKIQGYDIPKGSHIVVNNWGLHHDIRYWKNPETFYPERFLLDGDKEVIMKPESYNPFSYGKRNCPGETIAMMEILLYFTALMQNFTILPPSGKKLNLEGYLGLSYQAYPQELCFVPRH